ncbi:hypothetical protein [Janthinobacterium sp. CG3]|uniref:hypothetical protein n=1 Tax=Janthinobacterium sp. CG3 TaxID=1075768 RepID=UPI00037EA2FF|nr:hypothetical protein [Janthinobacterium sp. CG3]
MDEQTAVALLTEKVREYAQGRQQDVARGAERPRLAALLVQKYGLGIVDTVALLFDSPRAADPISKVVDEETAIIDPDWQENDRQRWAARPADLAL